MGISVLTKRVKIRFLRFHAMNYIKTADFNPIKKKSFRLNNPEIDVLPLHLLPGRLNRLDIPTSKFILTSSIIAYGNSIRSGVTQLNGWPAFSPVNASPTALRLWAQDPVA